MSNLIDLIPKMTSNTSSIGTVSASSVYRDSMPFKLFDKDNNNADGHRFATNANCPQWVEFKFNNPTCVNAYGLRAESTLWQFNMGSCLPKTWLFMASNTGLFTGEEIILDTITNFMAQKNDNTEPIFYFNNNTKYIYYRLLWTDLDRTDNRKEWTIINEWGLYYHQYNKYLIKQNDQYYNINSENYQNGAFIPLTLTGGNTPNEDDYNNLGFDNINDLCVPITVGDETFKPIDKLNTQFEIRMLRQN
ncbi:hypothetical protein ACFHWD_04400 [Clostridium sp. MT-14]|uniref:hypothetical protein n=1 Tax=Clostridium sp. MT-14 TaxID=3348360 RepID=UPI0035F34BC7